VIGLALAGLALAAGCAGGGKPVAAGGSGADEAVLLDGIADDYVRLSLAIGETEPGYIDAYYGPAEWQQQAAASGRDAAALAAAVEALDRRLEALAEPADPLALRRQRALRAQINAARTRLAMQRGERLPFQAEAIGLFGAAPALQPLESYDPALAEIAALVPGDAPLDQRVEAFLDRYVIPTDRLQPVFDRAIAECRARTLAHIALPPGERFTMEFVTDKPWSGYNYYQGGYHSLIQINTDLPIRISRAVDLGCHEGYPGHHALNALLEARLTRGRGWREFSVYPLYSPQSLIAEGSANYGIELAFPGDERLTFERDVLYPLAGLDPAGAERYDRVRRAIDRLSGARLTIARLYLDGSIDRAEAVALSQRYLLLSAARAEQSVRFTDTYRSYVINYGLGQDMVRDFVEAAGTDPAARWAAMERVIAEPTVPADLVPAALAAPAP